MQRKLKSKLRDFVLNLVLNWTSFCIWSQGWAEPHSDWKTSQEVIQAFKPAMSFSQSEIVTFIVADTDEFTQSFSLNETWKTHKR